DSSGATNCPSQTRVGPPSIGNPFAKRKRCRRLPGDTAAEAALLSYFACVWAAKVLHVARVYQESATPRRSVSFPSVFSLTNVPPNVRPLYYWRSVKVLG